MFRVSIVCHLEQLGSGKAPTSNVGQKFRENESAISSEGADMETKKMPTNTAPSRLLPQNAMRVVEPISFAALFTC